MEILLLCTGNICRSPMAEALLRRHLADAGVDATVSSAGLIFDGEPASAHAVTVLADVGLDLSTHRSRILGAALVERADLVVGMERRHVREVALLDGAALDRTFTLKELVRMAEAAGPRPHHDDVTIYLARLGAGRRPRDLLGASAADDVDDPYGRRSRAYRATHAELDDLLARLVAHLWPPHDADRTAVDDAAESARRSSGNDETRIREAGAAAAAQGR